MAPLPVTTAHLRVHRQSFSEQCLEGEVQAGGFLWQFQWFFNRGELSVEPSLGRALIQDALLRFLVHWPHWPLALGLSPESVLELEWSGALLCYPATASM